jgi:hypothetical protein
MQVLSLLLQASQPPSGQQQSFFSFGGFLGNVTASILAGAIVLFLGYLFVERRLRLGERADRAAEAEQQRRERAEEAEEQGRTNRQAVLSIVHAELESNAAQRTTAVENLPHEDQRLVYPLFDVGMWQLVTTTPIFTALEPETAKALIRSYNRMTTANEQNAFLNDLHQGQTSLTVTMTAAASIEKDLVETVYNRYLEYRTYVRDALIERLEELKRHLDEAIDAVEHELGMTGMPPAASRTYRPDVPPKYAGRPPSWRPIEVTDPLEQHTKDATDDD